MSEVFKVTEEQKNDARDAFKLFDKRDVGKISLKELGSVFRSLGRSLKPDQVREWASEVDEDDAKEAFKLFDKKGEGKMPVKELGSVFKSVGLKLTPEKLQEFADEVDVDGSGYIDFEEFLPLYIRKLKEDEDEKELREAFRVLDKNKTGSIDVEDLRWILKELGDDLTESEIEDMICETDTDASGTVDYDEFLALMTGS